MTAAFKAGGFTPAQVVLDNGRLSVAQIAIPLSRVWTKTADGESAFFWRLINFRGPPLLDDLKRRPYATYSFLTCSIQRNS